MIVTRLCLAMCSGLLLFAGTALAQETSLQKRPSAEAHIVRIEYGWSCGICAGYAYRETVVEAGIARSVSKTNYSLNGIRDRANPDLKKKWKITAEEWDRAKAAIDTESLFAFPDRIGCPGCVDEPVDWIAVDYSDGTKKEIYANSGESALTEMAENIKAALARAPKKGSTHRP